MECFFTYKWLRSGKLLMTLVVVASLCSSVGYSQERFLEEIVVGFDIPRLLQKDIFVQYDGETVYVPLIEIFAFLEFRVQADLVNQRISGSFSDRSDKYLIDLTRARIKTKDVDRELPPTDYFYDGRDFYLRIDRYGELFGLHMIFDFSELRVILPLQEDFPAFQKLKRQKKRKVLAQKKVALKDVQILERPKGYASGGALDWRFSANPVGGGGQYFDVELGGMLLGGDLRLGGRGETRTGFEPSQYDYRWHYFVDRGRYLTQAEVGKIFTPGLLGHSMIGAQVTNRPEIRRKYFRTIEVSGEPGPGWEVELYVDGKLVDYQSTDETGRYDFNVDVFYGAMNVELKLYGPNGEIRTEEKHYRIPFNLIPKSEFEYMVAVGQGTGVDSARSFAQLGAYYGSFTRLTTGFNLDIPLNPKVEEKPLYSFDATLQLATNLTLSSSVSPQNRMTFDANYVWPRVITVGAHATKFYENSPAYRNLANLKYRWQLSLSTPLRIAGRYLGMRFNIAHDETFGVNSPTNMTYGFNTTVKPVHLNYVGQAKLATYAGKRKANLSSKIMGSVQFHRLFRPQFWVDYDHTRGQLLRYGLLITKRLWRSTQLTLSYEYSPQSNINSFMVTLRFFNSFVDVSSRTQMSGKRISWAQQQHGSVRFDHNHKRFMFDRRRAVGYGTAVVRPFLDENYNGLMDPTEVPVAGLKAKVAGVAGRPRGSDRTYYYDRLRPYDEYLVQIDQYSLDDPTLKPSHENYKIVLNPNVVTAIEVPIVMASEISGSVRRQVKKGTAGVGSVRVMLLNTTKDVLTEISTFSDGEFYYLGLLPGSYRAYLDPEQLARAGYVSQPESIEFEIKPIIGGEMIENISFIMAPAPIPIAPEPETTPGN